MLTQKISPLSVAFTIRSTILNCEQLSKWAEKLIFKILTLVDYNFNPKSRVSQETNMSAARRSFTAKFGRSHIFAGGAQKKEKLDAGEMAVEPKSCDLSQPLEKALLCGLKLPIQFWNISLYLIPPLILYSSSFWITITFSFFLPVTTKLAAVFYNIAHSKLL